jgi:hypothetical protein
MAMLERLAGFHAARGRLAPLPRISTASPSQLTRGDAMAGSGGDQRSAR